jgi:uncharacterized protein (TIGR03435 family)
MTPLASGVTDNTGKTIARKQPGRGGDSEHPGRVHYEEGLTRLLMRAYSVGAYDQIQGPDSLHTMYVVDAIMPPETTKEQLRLMLQNLLVERFKLASHRETKELAGYSLVVAKNGPKLKESTGDPPPLSAPPVPARNFDELAARLGPDGFPKEASWSSRAIERGESMTVPPIGTRVSFHGRTTHDLANYLWERMHIPVTDATGLTSKFDFSLTYLPDDAPPPSGPLADRYPPAPNVFKALDSQLGLTLEKGKIAVEMLIVDHIEKTPSEN